MKKLQMRQITIISRPTLRLIRDKNPHCLSGGNKLNTNKPAYFPPETACGSTTKGSQFGDFLKRNLDFLANRRRSFADSIKNINKDEAKRSSLDFFVTFCVKTKSMEIKNTLCFYSRRSWWFYRFLRTQYAVCFLQYAVCFLWGVIEWLGFWVLRFTCSQVHAFLSLILVISQIFESAVCRRLYTICFRWGVEHAVRNTL